MVICENGCGNVARFMYSPGGLGWVRDDGAGAVDSHCLCEGCAFVLLGWSGPLPESVALGAEGWR